MNLWELNILLRVKVFDNTHEKSHIIIVKESLCGYYCPKDIHIISKKEYFNIWNL